MSALTAQDKNRIKERLEDGEEFPVIVIDYPGQTMATLYSAMRNEFGKQWIQDLFRRRLSLTKRVAGLTEALVTAAMDRVQGKRVLCTDEEVKARNMICQVCDHYDKKKGRCQTCGCKVKRKAQLVSSKCPIGKW